MASLGPKNVEMTAELADGWLPLFYIPERAKDVWGDDMRAGFAKRSADLGPLDIVAGGLVAIGEDAAKVAEFARPMVALYVGGMGAKGRNFYNDLACRYGYEGPAKEVQDLYLDGKKQEAAAAVPDELVDEVALCGPKERIAELVEPWKKSPVTTMVVATVQTEALDVMAELVS